LYEIDARLVSSGGSIVDTRRDASAFPTVSIGKVYKPIYEWIEELSTVESTNTTSEIDSGNPPQDRKMIFYIDKNNVFHWEYPDDDQDYSITLGVISTGTTTSTIAGKLVDSFQSLELTAGDFVFNKTDGLRSEITSIDSDTQLTLKGDIISSGDYYELQDAAGITDYNLRKSTFDIVNMVIFNGGADLYGAGTLNYYFDDTTTSGKLAMKYKSWTDITRDLIDKEIKDGRLTEDNSTPGPFTFSRGAGGSNNRYGETTGDYNGGGGITTHWGTSVTTDNEYNTAVRNKATGDSNSTGSVRAAALTKRRGSPRWKGSISVKGYKYSAGELVKLTIRSGGIVGVLLRVKDVTHNVDRSGWSTILDLEEDEPKID